MAQLFFGVKHQIINRLDTFKPVADSKNYLYAHFDFLTEDWQGTVTALFTKQETTYAVVLNEEYECLVPWELLTEDGDIFVSCFSGNLITTTNARVYVRKSGYVEDAENTEPPTENIYNQLVDYIDTFKESITEEFNSLKNDVQSFEEDTTQDVTTFKQELLQDINTFETNLVSDINTFKNNLLQNLAVIDGGTFDDWKTEG